MISALISKFTLLNWTILILLLPLKWKLDLFALKGMCVNIQKIMSCKLNCSMLQLCTVRRRNLLAIFLCLTVNCENKLPKVYCVLRLRLKKFTSLKFHHSHKLSTAFSHQEKCPSPNFCLSIKQQFTSYNPIKSSSLAKFVALVSFLFKFNTGHANFGFTDVQYLQDGVLSFEKGLNGQNHP